MSVEALNNKEYSTKNELNNFFNQEIKEVVNSVPEMTENEIKQLNVTELHNILSQSEWKTYKDNNWEYIIVNHKNLKRKLYYTLWKPLKNGHTYIAVDTIDDYHISIWRKTWDKIIWVYAKIEDDNSIKSIHKWNLTYKNGDLLPQK